MDGRGVSPQFIRNLRTIEPYLRACFDPEQDAILIWAERPGKPKVHEFTSRRAFEEDTGFFNAQGQMMKRMVSLSMPDLEGFTIKRLHEIDTWQKHGDGKKFDDWLADREKEYRDGKKRQFKNDRAQYLKSHKQDFARVLENVKRGFVHENQKRPLSRAQVAALLVGQK